PIFIKKLINLNKNAIFFILHSILYNKCIFVFLKYKYLITCLFFDFQKIFIIKIYNYYYTNYFLYIYLAFFIFLHTFFLFLLFILNQ
ncbi:hypothetical protein IMG5_008180, partial [Ichthyophthirius multifiliis]